MGNPKSTVLQAAGELFGDKDPAAVDRWVAASYTQHSASPRTAPRRCAGSSRASARSSVMRAPG